MGVFEIKMNESVRNFVVLVLNNSKKVYELATSKKKFSAQLEKVPEDEANRILQNFEMK